MKNNNSIEDLFEELKGSFDVASPPPGHRERFLERMESPGKSTGGSGSRPWWRHLSIAASIALLLAASVFLFRTEPNRQDQVAEISPELTFYHYEILMKIRDKKARRFFQDLAVSKSLDAAELKARINQRIYEIDNNAQ